MTSKHNSQHKITNKQTQTWTHTKLCAPVSEVVEPDDIVSNPLTDVSHKMSQNCWSQMSTVERLRDVWRADITQILRGVKVNM